MKSSHRLPCGGSRYPPPTLSCRFCVLIGLGLLPLRVRSEYWLGILITALYFAMLAVSWNLLAGITGLFSMAPAAFAMVGAYTTGLLHHHWQAGSGRRNPGGCGGSRP